ncbi:LamG-like jellyroll fold domain-containing protein [Verrucomicrobium sp. BvORR106]|uniref:LamG-like jellyroll fold domain-containing protein n=1 Tax=Verrucomicrobium sp. BvORR106 TaxID=1403819 RepID=UPI000571CED0|nr:LamG-like jellyroll fold domain-containing protein [Verrucomicrobium sp. BvORR106]
MNPDLNFDSAELHRLFMAKADGHITAEDHERLSQMLKTSAEARRQWYAFQDVESALFSWSQQELQRVEEEPALTATVATAPTRLVRARLTWLLPLAALLAILVMVVNVMRQPAHLTTPKVVTAPLTDEDENEATTTSVALLTRGVNLEWVDAQSSPALNAPLSPGWLKLKAGIAELEFYQGARLVVEGPAEIKLVSAGEAYCVSGRFSAHVPPQARGFRLGTPNGDVVDLGTDFGLDLNSATPEVHVFKGEVELHQPEAQVRMLTTGEAAGFEKSTPARALPASDEAFAFSRDLDARMSESQRQSLVRWEEQGRQWNLDPRLKLRLDFQDPQGSRSLKNSAALGQEVAPGTIVGCIWTQGRWPEKKALQFRSVSDRVRLGLPGAHRQITMATWVQLHGLNVRQSSLCMSQGINEGHMHWQILHDGSLCLGVGSGTSPNVRSDDYITPVIFTPERFGQWVHLAVVYDLAGGEVTFYLNGGILSKHPVQTPTELAPTIMELGNWTPSPDKRQQPVRNFAGCMDEFSLYTAALRPDEIRALAE